MEIKHDCHGASLGLAVVDDLLVAHRFVTRKQMCGAMSHLILIVAQQQQFGVAA